MTTATDSIPAALEVPSRRSRTWLRFGGAFILGATLGLAVLVGGLLAWDSSFAGRVLPGVSAEGIDLSGLDREGALAALAAPSDRYGQGHVVIRADQVSRLVPYGAFDRRLDREAMVATAMAMGRAGSVWDRALGQVQLALRGGMVAPVVVFDQRRLAERVGAELAMLARPPVDATIRMTPDGIVTTDARRGIAYDADAATAAAASQVAAPSAPAETVIPAQAIAVQPARNDADVIIAKADAQRVTSDVVLKYGSKTWTLPAKTVRTWVHFEDGDGGSIRVDSDPVLIERSLGAVAKGVAMAPVSASFLTGKSGKIVGVTPSADGRRIDLPGTVAAIAAALDGRASGQAPAPIGVRVAAVAPKLTTDEASKAAPLMTLLGAWKTWFPISERNYYGANIWIPARTINGTVLAPGQRFEWWSAIGPVTAARGYGLGGVIKGDHTEPTGAMGGGMCSSSTTLFNAAMRAGLQMGARSNHKYYITRYPLGLDATVSKSPGGGGQTMSFVNDMPTPIFIRGIRIGGTSGKGWVRYEIWGIPDGRTVSLSAPVVRNVIDATTVVVPVTTLPHGVRKQTEVPSDGRDVVVTRTVRDAHGNVIHRDAWYSHYVLWNGRIEVGV